MVCDERQQLRGRSRIRTRLRALAIAGGVSGDPASPHFNDQAQRFAREASRPIYFYPDELSGNVGRKYRPGEQVSR